MVPNIDYQKERFTVVRQPQREPTLWDPTEKAGKISVVKCWALEFIAVGRGEEYLA